MNAITTSNTTNSQTYRFIKLISFIRNQTSVSIRTFLPQFWQIGLWNFFELLKKVPILHTSQQSREYVSCLFHFHCFRCDYHRNKRPLLLANGQEELGNSPTSSGQIFMHIVPYVSSNENIQLYISSLIIILIRKNNGVFREEIKKKIDLFDFRRTLILFYWGG